MTWTARVLTLFPGMFPGPLDDSLIGKARAEGIWALETLDIRAFARDKHRSVDDTPAGGGPGMVMRADVIAAALDGQGDTGSGSTGSGGSEAKAPSAAGSDWPMICLSPRGAPFTQARARALAAGSGVTLLCGRYEGIDQRVIEARGLEELSLGDFVLSGGEIAAMAVIDAVVRLLPGALGAAASVVEESFEGGLLEYPQYTRPRRFEGRDIPEALLSGDHARIAEWRRRRAEEITRARRPDLWRAYAEATGREADAAARAVDELARRPDRRRAADIDERGGS